MARGVIPRQPAKTGRQEGARVARGLAGSASGGRTQGRTASFPKTKRKATASAQAIAAKRKAAKAKANHDEIVIAAANRRRLRAMFSKREENLEATPKQTLAVERHSLRIHLQARVTHHGSIDVRYRRNRWLSPSPPLG